MFVILRGKVGVYNSEGTGFNEAAKPKYVLRRGEIIGELAYALSRNRTADLVALSDVALLSFNYEDIQSRLPDTRTGQNVADRVSAYINYRILQHASDNAPYLLGAPRKGPLAVGVDRWDYALTILRQHCELIVVRQSVLDLTLDKLPAQGFERGAVSAHEPSDRQIPGQIRVRCLPVPLQKRLDRRAANLPAHDRRRY